MKTTFLALAVVLSSSMLSFAQSRWITLSIGGETQVSSLAIGTNEVAHIRGIWGAVAGQHIEVSKDSCTWRIEGSTVASVGDRGDIPIAGPALLALKAGSGVTTNNAVGATIEVTPESFPPDKTIILPEGTVGTVHVESSTNLIHWQDEWTQTFANTNDNRFFRLRAERSLP